MKTKIITLHTPELRTDLEYDKYCMSEELSYRLRPVPLDIDVEKELVYLRDQCISESVDGGKIISISSRIIGDPTNFSPLEEITINYE